jgi:23S rRNA pseudouridine1911/1915/1917 synthase
MIKLTVPYELKNQRFDTVVAELCPEYSRSQLQKWIRSGDVTVNGKQLKPKVHLKEDDEIIVIPQITEETTDEPEDIPLDIVFEDDHILVVNKQAGLVVHPAVGNRTGTLVNGLLFHCIELQQIPRAGIVHRLDKDTSGLMVVAKTLQAHKSLVSQLQERTVKRRYLALVQGEVISGATIEGNIGRHPVDRKRMAVVDGGKHAITHYRIEQRFSGYTLLRVQLETGRTHQIRVHMSWQHKPIVGDHVYGGRPRIPARIDADLREALLHFPRQALHATQLGMDHPDTGEWMEWQRDMPDDMQLMVDQLEAASEPG